MENLKPKIIILCTQMRNQARGVMLAALWKCRRFVERGFDAEIRLFEYVLDFPLIRQGLEESGRSLPGMKTVNIHEFLSKQDAPPIRGIEGSRRSDLEIRKKEANVVDKVSYRGQLRFKAWATDREDGLNYVEFYRADGTVYLRGLCYDRSMLHGANELEWVRQDGLVCGRFTTERDLWAFWLKYGVPRHQPLVIIQDGAIMGRNGMEIFSNIVNDERVVNIAVAHGATLRDRFDQFDGPVPAWKLRNRYWGAPDKMVFLTDEQKEQWDDLFGEPTLTVTIPHECRVDEHNYGERVGNRVVAIASLTVLKRNDDLIDAFHMATKEMNDAVLEIYGEGPERENLQRQIDELALTDRVYLKGYTADAREALRGACANVITSEREAFGMPIVEAMSYGTPTISYDIDFGPRYIIGADSDCGVLVPNGDVEALASAIKALLLTKPDDDIRLRSFKRSKRFSAEVVTQEWLKLIDELVSNTRQFNALASIEIDDKVS